MFLPEIFNPEFYTILIIFVQKQLLEASFMKRPKVRFGTADRDPRDRSSYPTPCLGIYFYKVDLPPSFVQMLTNSPTLALALD